MATAMTANATMPALRPKRPKRLPVKYSDAVADRIVEAVSEGKTFTDIAREPWSPNRRTLFRFMDAHPDFRQAVEQARKQAADKLFAELLAIKDQLRSGEVDYKDAKGLVSAAEIIRWTLARMDAARWGDKMQTTPPVAVQIVTTLNLDPSKPASETIDGSNVYDLRPRLPIVDVQADV
jgi:hypothetical protein